MERSGHGGAETSMTDGKQSGKDAFAEAFRKAVMDYRFGVDGELKKPVTFVAAENGLFEVRQNAIGTFARKVDGVPGMGQVAEGFVSALPKLPWTLFEQAVSFFRAVMKRHGGAESYIQFFWNKAEGNYFAHVPRQYVSGGHVSFDRDVEVEAQHILVMEAHSHNTMGAFWSGTDNADEQADRLFMVMGHLDQRTPEVRVRCAMGGKHVDLSIEETFETPLGQEVSQSWLDQVSPPTQETGVVLRSHPVELRTYADTGQGVLFEHGSVRDGGEGPREGGDDPGNAAVDAGAVGGPAAEDARDRLRWDGGLGDSSHCEADQEPGSGESGDRGRRCG